MFGFKKNVCVLFVILAVALVVNPISAIEEYGIDYNESFNDTTIDGLDISWADESDEFGVAPVYDNGNMYAIKTWVSKLRPVKITHSLDTSVNNGMFYISFDYYTEDNYNDCYLRLLSGEKQFQICGFRNTGKFGHFLDFSKWTLDSETAVDYTYDKWYTVGVLFDMDSRNSYFYFGEKDKELSLIETAVLNDEFKNITDVVFVHSFGDYTPAIWDNINIYNVTTDTIENIEKKEKILFDKNIYEKYINKVYTDNFERNLLPDLDIKSWSDINDSNGIVREKHNSGYVLKTWVDSKYPIRLTHSFENPINDGIYYLSFDWLSQKQANDCYLRLLSSEKQFQVCGFRPDGKFGKFVNFTNWFLNHDTETEYSPDKWYTVGVLMDFDLRKVYIYFGEQNGTLTLIEKTSMADDFTNITDFVLVHSFGNYTEALWDNIDVYKLNAETAKVMEEQEKVVFDTYITDGISCVISTEKTGNIFHNADTAKVFVKYYNRSMVYENLDISYKSQYNNQVIYSHNEKLNVKKDGEAEYTLSIPIKDKYGFFTFDVLNGTEKKSESRFSNARTAQDGAVNHKMGATVHATRVKDKTATFDILKNGGFSSVRGGQNDWSDVETKKGVYTKNTDNTFFYENAVIDGFEVMTILKGSNSLYADEFPTSNPDREGAVENPPKSDGLIEKFREYCYQTVVMYPDVKYFQIWNEWNNAPTFNNDGITDASYYAKVLKAGYEGVKRGAEERGSEALVVAMAPSGTKTDWIGAVLKTLDGEKCFDIVSVHPYTYTDGGINSKSTYAPEDVCIRHTKELGDVVTRLKRVYSTLESYGYSNVPVWAGEFGFSSYICGEENQARYATRMMALCDGNSLLDKMLWYTFQNHLSVNETEQNYGMIRYDENVLVPYEAKPVYLAMSNYNALMAQAKPSQKISEGKDDVYAYKFVARDNEELYTVWTCENEGTYSLDIGEKFAKIYDMYGNEKTIVSENGVFTFDISESITYIKVYKTHIGLIQNGNEITELSELTDDDVYVAMQSTENENCEGFAAIYKDGIMTEIKKCMVGSEFVNLGKIDNNIDEIRLFLWSDLIPILEKKVIK